MRAHAYKGSHIADQFTFGPLDPSTSITNGLGNYISTCKTNSGLDGAQGDDYSQATIVILAVTPPSYSIFTT